MSYIGNTVTTQAFTPAVDFFNGDGVTVAFTLSRPVASVAQVQAVISNVPQNPGSAYTVSGNTITFTSAPPSGTSNIYVYYTSPITQVIAPGQGSVTTTSLGTITNIASGNSNLTLQTGLTPTTALTIDTSQNVGLGVTPSNWNYPSSSALQVKNTALWGLSNSSYLMANTFVDSSGSTKYIANGYASYLQQSNGQFSFWTAGTSSGTAGAAWTGTQAMTLDASGRLIIGGTNYSSTYSAAPLQVTAGTTNAAGIVLMGRSSDNIGDIYITNNAGTTGYASIEGTTSGLVLSGLGATNVIFGTNGSERARITSGGYFKASSTGTYNSSTGSYHELRGSAADTALYVQNTNASSPYGIEIDYTAIDPNGTGNAFLGCYGITTLRAQFRSNGGLANYSANNVNLSDRREKTNFAPAGDYLSKICAIPVQTYNYIDQDLENDPGLTLGVVAQDVQAVAPELVMESDWAKPGEEPKMRLSVYQTDLQYALMKCIQEQQALIVSMREELDALKDKVGA